MNAAIPLMARLKSGTEQQHREIETLVDPFKNFCSREAYKTHALKTWMFYRSMESDLATVDWTPAGMDFEPRRKTVLLEEDLRVLDVSCAARDDAPRHLDPADLDFAIGCLYVLEGATLGGQVISRHLAKLGIGPGNGGRFFHGYGTRTGAMWKSFQASATGYCLTGNQIEQALRGAQSTFERYRTAMFG